MFSTKVYAKRTEYLEVISSKHVIKYQRLFSLVVAKDEYFYIYLEDGIPSWCKKQSRLGRLKVQFGNHRKSPCEFQRAFGTYQ